MNRIRLKTAGLIIMLALVSELSTAQEYSRYNFGILIEPQITWLKSDNTKKIDSKKPISTINIGFEADKYFAKRYAFTTGLSLNSIGGKVLIKDSSNIHTVNDDYKLSPKSSVKFRGQYLTIPIGLKFRSTQVGYISFYASLGIKANINIKGYTWFSKEDIESPITSEDIEKEKTNDHFNIVYPSYFMHLGIEYSLGGDSESAVQLGITYNGGITSLLDSKKFDENIDAGITGQTFAIRLGFMF